MNRMLRIFWWIGLIVAMIAVFVLLVPSLFAMLMAGLLIFAIYDYSARRYRSAAQTLNSAIRAVCHHDGAITKVAIAFSKSGPLSGPCYEYARRLMMGQGAIEAAARARVPLQLSTAVAIESPTPVKASRQAMDQRDLEVLDDGFMPAYGQFLYLTTTAMVTCIVLTFMATFIVPTLEVMFEEFGMEFRYRHLFSLTPAILILAFLGFVVIVATPLVNRGHLFGVPLPRWLPMMPQLAQRKADVLHGLADAIDVGWPMGRALAVGHTISVRSAERRSLERAMELIEQGRTPAAAIHRTGWIDVTEASWLEGASPQRTVELLRTIADQGVRDAWSNLRWLMTIFFPLVVLLLGTSVLAYAYGFFGTLMELIRGLS